MYTVKLWSDATLSSSPALEIRRNVNYARERLKIVRDKAKKKRLQARTSTGATKEGNGVGKPYDMSNYKLTPRTS